MQASAISRAPETSSHPPTHPWTNRPIDGPTVTVAVTVLELVVKRSRVVNEACTV